MRFSGEGATGIVLALVGLGGMGVLAIWPERTEIGGALIVIALVGLVILWLFHRLHIQLTKTATSLHVGENHFLVRKKSTVYGFRKTLLIGIANESANESLSNGHLQIISITPYVGNHGPWTVKHNISANPGGCDFVPLIEFSESSGSTNAGTFATILTEGQHKPLLDINERYELALHLTADGRPHVGHRCEVWFELGKIHIKELSKP
jgi:hypothetical protein